MTRDIEKNDVDISQLFRWKKEVELSDAIGGSKLTVYMRLAGDADINRARTYGYRKAGELRRSLKTDGSPDRMSLLAEIKDFDSQDMLIQTLILLRLGDIYQQATKDSFLKEPTEPASDATQEAWEDYQKAVDEYPEKFKDAVRKRAEELQKVEEEKLIKKTPEELYNMYEGEIINRVCMEEMQLRYYDMCVYLGTYKDENYKVPAFKNFDSFDNIHTQLKTKLREEYQGLEVGLDFLKKLPEATE